MLPGFDCLSPYVSHKGPINSDFTLCAYMLVFQIMSYNYSEIITALLVCGLTSSLMSLLLLMLSIRDLMFTTLFATNLHILASCLLIMIVSSQ